MPGKKIKIKALPVVPRDELNKSTWVWIALREIEKKYKGKNFREFINENKIIEFLVTHYELLHYYGFDYVVDDAKKYVEERKEGKWN
jgi:hypothetical protein